MLTEDNLMVDKSFSKNVYGEKIDRSPLTFAKSMKVFLKGILMGICDVIPGVSGGTIAFITGIYLRLISAIKELNFKNAFDLLRSGQKFDFKKIGKILKRMDIFFLIVLFFGITSAILSVSRVIGFLLDNYLVYTLAFFMGLVLMSSKVIFDSITSHRKRNIAFGIVGFVIGLSMIFFREGNVVDPSFVYIFFSGFIAIAALFLPGISGSFILLILGVYEFMIDALHNVLENYLYVFVFLAGAAGGMFFISRLITWLYKKNKSKTLYVLLGIVLGSLAVPGKQVFSILTNSTISGNESFILIMLAVLVFFIAGLLAVFIVQRISREK